MEQNPKVFISYSHQDAEFEEKVLAFSDKLRSEGIDANIDLYEEAPVEGWPRWMENQIKSSDFVLVICDKAYHDKFYSDEKGKGVSWEVNIVYQLLYDSFSENSKFVPVFFDANDEQYIPTPLKTFTFYNIDDKDGYEKLYWRLRGVSKREKPPLGKLRPLPEKARKTMFFTSPIELSKWDAARWKGMLYLFQPGASPVLGLLFDNYTAAKDIFTTWKEDTKCGFADEFLKVDFVTPPFPETCWVNFDAGRSNGNGYFVHIGTNVNEAILRAKGSGLNLPDTIIATVSRYQWMDEPNGSGNRDRFREEVQKGIPYFLMPIGIRDDNKPITEENLIIDFAYAVKMKDVNFVAGISVAEDCMCKVVLSKPTVI